MGKGILHLNNKKEKNFNLILFKFIFLWYNIIVVIGCKFYKNIRKLEFITLLIKFMCRRK